MILITGATGFVGQALLSQLLNQSYDVQASVRRELNASLLDVKKFNVGDILPTTDWSAALENVDIVIHLAARVHVKGDDVEAEFRMVNTEATLNLAIQAMASGVKRFIFLSSIGVNGSHNTRPFTALDKPDPQTPYAISKFEAEQGLLSLQKNSKMDVIIIRPPLVYGPKAPGNFLTLVKWINRSVPLPLGAVDNQRAFIALDNLVDFIILCIEHPQAANEIFVISDGESISTTELLRKITRAFGKKVLLLPVPVKIMIVIANLIGKDHISKQLFGSLQVDNSKANELLGWKPVISMERQLKIIVDKYK